MYSFLANASGAIWLYAAGICVGAYLLFDLIRDAFTRDWDIVDYVEVQDGEIVDPLDEPR